MDHAPYSLSFAFAWHQRVQLGERGGGHEWRLRRRRSRAHERVIPTLRRYSATARLPMSMASLSAVLACHSCNAGRERNKAGVQSAAAPVSREFTSALLSTRGTSVPAHLFASSHALARVLNCVHLSPRNNIQNVRHSNISAHVLRAPRPRVTSFSHTGGYDVYGSRSLPTHS